MSISLMSDLFRSRLPSSNMKFVAVRLADFADHDGRGVWPSMGRVAAECGLSKDTVRRAISGLEKMGILVKIKDGGQGPRSTNRYDFNLSQVENLPRINGDDRKNSKNKGSTVLPLAKIRVANEDAKGSTDTKKGSHRATQTISNHKDTHQQRERGRTPENGADAPEREIQPDGDQKENANTLQEDKINDHPSKQQSERLFQKCLKRWPALGDSIKKAQEEWQAMPWTLCQLVDERLDEFIALRRAAGRNVFLAFSTFLQERHIETMPDRPEKVEAKSVPSMLKRFGNVWAVLRLRSLTGGKRGEWHPKHFEQELIDEGKGHFLTGKRHKAEFRFVATIDEVNLRLDVDRIPPKAVLDECRWFTEGSEGWLAWQAWHEANDLPFYPALVDGLEGAWFAGEVPPHDDFRRPIQPDDRSRAGTSLHDDCPASEGNNS